MVAVMTRTEIDMLQCRATDEKQRRSRILSFAAIAIVVMLFALYLASQFTQRVEPDQLTVLYPDGRSSVKKIVPSWLIDEVVEGPVQLEMTFPTCRRFDRYRFWVGTDGLDSAIRQPSAWTLWVNNGGNAWTLADTQITSKSYFNGLWYAYPLKTGKECVNRVRVDVDEISGSNVLRLYKFQLYESWYLERAASSWVDRNETLASSVLYISATYAALLRIPWIQTAFNTTIAVIVALLGVELLLTGWQKSALNRLLFHRNSSANRDLACAFILGLGYLGAFATIYSLGGDKLTGMISNLVIAKLSPFGLQLNSGLVVFDILIYLLVVSFFDYWSHRILHSKLFWPLHRFHHSATEFNTLTVYRNHPALAAWDPLIQMWPLAFLPMTPSISEYWPLVVLLWHTLQMVNHSDFDWTYGWIGRWLLMSPGMHKVHHSNNPEHFNKNLGNLFVIWDRIFGTYQDVSPQPIALGLLGEDGNLSQQWTVVEWALDIKHLLTGKYTRWGADTARTN
jgi:sterol desaturase/sphingolipid hydroxylase (fatty acid hydroxylase superfamily)